MFCRKQHSLSAQIINSQQPQIILQLYPLAVVAGAGSYGKAGFVRIDCRSDVVFTVAIGFQTLHKVRDQGWEWVTVNIAGFFDSGVDLKKFFLFAETFQIKTVVEDRTFFADDVRIGSVGHKARQTAAENPLGAVGKSDLRCFHRRVIIPIAV